MMEKETIIIFPALFDLVGHELLEMFNRDASATKFSHLLREILS